MADRAHTPGPWEIGRYGLHDFEVQGHREEGGSVQVAVLRGMLSKPAPGTLGRNYVDEPIPQAWANAALIAAAPQLLESLLAVEWAGNRLDDVTGDDIDCCPNCGAALGSLHTPRCELRDSLDAALGVTSPRAEVVR